MNREYLWTSIYLIKSIIEAIDKVEEDYDQSRISGSKPAHLKEAATEAIEIWYQGYLDALDRAVKEIDNEAIELEARNDSRQSSEG